MFGVVGYSGGKRILFSNEIYLRGCDWNVVLLVIWGFVLVLVILLVLIWVVYK